LRPLRNKSNFWDETSGEILNAASHRMANRQFPPEELASEGWLRVIRYGKEHKYIYLHCCREMANYIKRARCLQRRQKSFVKLEPLDPSLFWVDYLDGLKPYEKETVAVCFIGKNSMKNAGEMLGVTKEAIRMRLIKIVNKIR
jgi:hypothetical protein